MGVTLFNVVLFIDDIKCVQTESNSEDMDNNIFLRCSLKCL